MIAIDHTKCTRCGSCVRICHEQCLHIEGDELRIDRSVCSTCSQCIAICPQQALSWEGVLPAAFEPSRLPTPEQMDELFKERRTIRRFKEQWVERSLLEEIVRYGSYAPTNNYSLRAIVVDDPALVDELDQINLRAVSRIYHLLFRHKLVFNLMRRLTPTLDPKDRVKIEETMQRGHTFHHPPALVFVVGDPRVALSVESAQYALYNMILYAQVKGLGTVLWGASTIFLNRLKAARQLLGLRQRERIFGAFGIGYPAVRFRNKVEGKALLTTWIPGEKGEM